MARMKNEEPEEGTGREEIVERPQELRLQWLTHTLGLGKPILARIADNVRADTARSLKDDLAQVGIEVPASITKSLKWFQEFHSVPVAPEPRDGLKASLRTNLLEIGLEEDRIAKLVDDFEHEVESVELNVERAVAVELRDDLEEIGVRIPPSILESAKWRDVLARQPRRVHPAWHL